MTSSNFIRSAVAAGLIGLAATAGAQAPAPRKVPPAPKPADTTLIPMQKLTPPPSSVRPTGIAPRLQRPTAAVVAPMAPPSVSPAALQASASVTPATPPALTVPPPQPAANLAAAQAQAAAPVSPLPPAGASMRCKDGTFLSGTPSDAACAAHDGLLASFVKPSVAPTPPRKP